MTIARTRAKPGAVGGPAAQAEAVLPVAAYRSARGGRLGCARFAIITERARPARSLQMAEWVDHPAGGSGAVWHLELTGTTGASAGIRWPSKGARGPSTPAGEG